MPAAEQLKNSVHIENIHVNMCSHLYQSFTAIHQRSGFTNYLTVYDKIIETLS